MAIPTLTAILLRKYFYAIWKNEKFWRLCSIGLFLLIAAGFLYAGLSLKVYPSWDFGSVYLGAVELAENGIFSEQSKWYFTTYPNNVAVCLLLTGIFKVFGGIGDYIILGVLLNVFLMLLGIAFLFLLVCHLYGVRAGFLAMLVCALFAPFYMHTPIFYTDTFALPFVTGSFWVYQLRKRDAKFLILTAVILAVGYKVKGSLGVILIALLIHTWLQKKKVLEFVKHGLMLLLPFLLVVGFLTALPGRISLWDAEDREKNEFPFEHWLAMGLEGSGGYNGDIYWMTASVEGKAEKVSVDREFIRNRLREYGIDGMGWHLKEKILFTWGDGVYFAPEKLKRDPLQESPLHSWVLYDGAKYGRTYRYCSAVHWLLLLGMLFSVLCNFLENGEYREAQAMQIAVLGLFLFLLIWETRSRYLVNFVPIFILLGIDSIWVISRYIVRRRKMYKR
ncbi:MAG: hypothetical protein HFI28_07140 [Lachnospiraceae bacterium]|nr:hypothetical protein [Lachnospiraceae bacterium]